MIYACGFLSISLCSCPSHLGILEIFHITPYRATLFFINAARCPIVQIYVIYLTSRPAVDGHLDVFCTQYYSEHPCINIPLHCFDYVYHMSVWQSSFKEALLYTYSLFQPLSIEHLM